MKKLLVVAVVLACILMAAYTEYRYIMKNLNPYTGENGAVYIEIFGQVDEYSASPLSDLGDN